jgi:hypothetical protein
MNNYKEVGQTSDEAYERETYERFVNEGKCEINNCFYPLVPASMTMGEFERITGSAFDAIRDAWEEWINKRDNIKEK